MLLPTLIVLAVFVIIVLIGLAFSLRVVPGEQRLVVFRLGRFAGARGPGLVLLLPLLDRGVKVDLRAQTETISDLELLLHDRTTMCVNMTYTFRVVDAAASVLHVADPHAALCQLLCTTMQTLAASQTRGDVLIQLTALENELVARVRETVRGWGMDLEDVKIAPLNELPVR